MADLAESGSKPGSIKDTNEHTSAVTSGANSALPSTLHSPVLEPKNDFSKNDEGTTVSSSEKVSYSKYALVTFLCMCVAMGGFIFGYDTGTISGFINMEVFLEKFGQQNSHGGYYLSKTRSGLMVSIVSIGAGIGGIFLSKAGDIYGRKKAISFACILYIVGLLIQITAVDKWYQVFIGRLIGGHAIGMFAVLVPMFQSETAPKEIRGTLVSFFQLFVTLGIFIGYCVCYGTEKRSDTGSYRIPLGLGFLWALILMIAMVGMPESPRWLVDVDRIEDAKKSLAFTTRSKVTDARVIEEIDEIYASISKEREVGKARWSELLFGQPKCGYRTFVGMMVMALQQLCGANYFFYYGTTIFKAIGMNNSFATSMIFGAVNFGSTFFGLYFVERFGRRTCLLWGASGMAVFFLIYTCLGVKQLYPHGSSEPSNVSVGKGMIAVTCFYIFCFATTWAPIAFVMVSEVFPLRIKPKGMGVANAANWIFNFLIGFFTPFITGAINFYYGFVFTGSLIFAVVFVFFFVPETKGLSLEEIDEMFASGVNPIKSSKWVPSHHVQPSSDMDKPTAEHHVPVVDISEQV